MEGWVKAMRDVARKSKADPEKAASDADAIIRSVLLCVGAKHLVAAWDEVERY